MSPANPALDAVDITSMGRYREHGYPWADWDLRRDQAPIYRYEGRPRFGPFWAVTRHRDIRWISSRPPHAVAEDFVARFVDVARRAAPDPVDLVEELAVGIPIATICGLLGVPGEDWTTIRRWSSSRPTWIIRTCARVKRPPMYGAAPVANTTSTASSSSTGPAADRHRR